MEFYANEQGFLEELLGLSREREYCTNYHDFSNNISWSSSLDGFSSGHINNYSLMPTNTLFHDYALFYDAPFGQEPSPPEFTSDSSNKKLEPHTFPYFQEDYCSSTSRAIFDEEDGGAAAAAIFGKWIQDLDVGAPCKVEPASEMPVFNMGFTSHEVNERKEKVKKVNGQPSKNLMAERRRRKRLNDRLSMLRSVVPKISKMDRTSIVGDTIDYMKELLERINNLQEGMGVGTNQLELLNIFKDVKPNEILVRNSPKFDVERRDSDTRIEISCAGKPGLLLSTVTTLEALGMEIQQCVISCFNDFAMHASCSDQEMKQCAVLDSEDIKQALFRNAGYGGRCL